MAIILQLGPVGLVVIACQLILFYALVSSSLAVSSKTKPLLRLLGQSLADFQDRFGDEDNVVTRARTRYRRALEQIEKVDTQLITSSMLSYTEAARVFRRRLSYSEYDQFIRSGPSILITLGLLGTFVGLTGNLTELSSILDSAKASPAESLQKASAILAPMATAFISSLVAVSLSLACWAIGTSKGLNTVVADLNELMGAYLDQVVQANSKRYSLIRESLERMEEYLTRFLVSFSDHVGKSIDKALRDKIGEVFESLRQSAEANDRYVSFLESGCTDLKAAATTFKMASETLSSSDFPTAFSEATHDFISATRDASERTLSLIKSTTALDDTLVKIKNLHEESKIYFGDVRASIKSQAETMEKALELGNKNAQGLTLIARKLDESHQAITRHAAINSEVTDSLSECIESMKRIVAEISESLQSTRKQSDEQFQFYIVRMMSVLEEVRKLSDSLIQRNSTSSAPEKNDTQRFFGWNQ